MTIDELLNEEAAANTVSADSVANFNGSLFRGGIIARKLGDDLPTYPQKPGIPTYNTKKRKTVAGIPVIRYQQEAN